VSWLGVGAAAWVVLAAVSAGFLLLPLARATRLGVLHPAVAWLVLEVVFFGVGSIDLALVDDRPGPALYLGAAALALAAGARLSHRIAVRRASSARVPPPDPATRPRVEEGPRRLVPALCALVALAAIAPSLLATGLPLLASDATAARAQLVGVPVQLLRVALPGLAAVLLLELLVVRPAAPRRIASACLIVGLAILAGLLASRYLVAELLATLVLAWLLAGRRIPLRAATIAGLVAVLGFAVLGVVRAPEDFAGSPVRIALERTASRLFLVQPRTLDAFQTAIPAEEPYFLGLTWVRRLGPVLGRDDIPNLGYWIYPRVVRGEQDIAGYAAPGLIGEAWANFGPAGLWLFLVLGFGLERLGVLLAWRRSAVVDLAAGAMAILFVARAHALGLLGMALLLALVVIWRLLAGRPAGLVRDVAVALHWHDPNQVGNGPAGASASVHRTVVPGVAGDSADIARGGPALIL
jgi:hypothetical protein